ncbi:MAG TPA: hypothetical protein PK514_05590 [Spirochaetota bacterium]|nr:hypothetical protein [Spirochaetota bacterium]
MRNRMLLIIIAGAITFGACTKSKGVDFCEGVDTEGKGVSCGKEFTTGDLTGVLTADQPFEAENISVKIMREENGKVKPEKNISVAVDREKKRVSFDLSFYNPGKYSVEAFKESDKIGEGELIVTDTY